MKLTQTIIHFIAFGMSGELPVKKQIDMLDAIKILKKEYGETAQLIKIKIGDIIIENHAYVPFTIKTNYSKNLLKNK